MEEMKYIQVGGKTIELNDEGYLANFDDWDEEFARILAEEDSLTLEHCHWEAIRFMREFYVEYNVNPSPRIVIKTIGEKLTAEKKCTRRVLDELFPRGGCKQVCRIAGLPHYYCHSC